MIILNVYVRLIFILKNFINPSLYFMLSVYTQNNNFNLINQLIHSIFLFNLFQILHFAKINEQSNNFKDSYFILLKDDLHHLEISFIQVFKSREYFINYLLIIQFGMNEYFINYCSVNKFLIDLNVNSI